VSDGAGEPAAAVVTTHAFTVVDPEEELPAPLELLELHAAAPVATAAASATAASARLLLRIVDS
jgi:hypothetical protein